MIKSQQITKVHDSLILLREELKRIPTLEEISERVKIPIPQVEKILKKTIENFSATIQFFAIFEKGKQIKVLPHLLNRKFMTNDEMNQLHLGEALSATIIIPAEPKPWSLISKTADHIFLALQSRMSWGEPIDQKTNLLKISSVLDLVLIMENSLNNYSWRKDYLLGKFNSNAPDSSLIEPKEKTFPVKVEIEGTEAGKNWS